MVLLISYLLSSMGLTILVVWPSGGPSAWVREQILRPVLKYLFAVLPGTGEKVLDCYVCFGFWAGLVLGGVWWGLFDVIWSWFGCLMVPAMFWLLVPVGKAGRVNLLDREGPP